MADATEAKKIDPKAAKGMLIGAAAAVLNAENNWRSRDQLRNAIRACDKAGVKREEIEKIVGSAVAADVSPVYEEKAMSVAESPVYMSPVEKALAKLGSAQVPVTEKAFFAGFSLGMSGHMKQASTLTAKARTAVLSKFPAIK